MNDDVPGAVLLSHIRGVRPEHTYLNEMRSVGMVRALHAAGVDIAESIIGLFAAPHDRLPTLAEVMELTGYDVNTVHNQFFNTGTLLHYAVEMGSLHKLNFVLAQHPDLSVRNYNDVTALELSEWYEQQMTFDPIDHISERLRQYAAANA